MIDEKEVPLCKQILKEMTSFEKDFTYSNKNMSVHQIMEMWKLKRLKIPKNLFGNQVALDETVKYIFTHSFHKPEFPELDSIDSLTSITQSGIIKVDKYVNLTTSYLIAGIIMFIDPKFKMKPFDCSIKSLNGISFNDLKGDYSLKLRNKILHTTIPIVKYTILSSELKQKLINEFNSL